MIKPNQAQPNLVFRDPHLTPALQLFRFTEQLPDGSWRAEQVSSRRRKAIRIYSEHELERLMPVPREPRVDFDLDAIIGKKVRLRTGFGSALGVVTRVREQELTVCGMRYMVPAEVYIDTEGYRIASLTSIEILKDER